MTDVLVKPPARCPTMAPSTRTLKSLFRLELQRGCATAAVEPPISSNLHHEPTSNLPTYLPHLPRLPRLPRLPSDQIYAIPIASSRPAAICILRNLRILRSLRSVRLATNHLAVSAARLQLSQQRSPYCNPRTVPQHLSTE